MKARKKFIMKNLFIGLFIGGILALFINFVFADDNRESYLFGHSKYIFGIDISHYQGNINWNKLQKSHHPIKYIFIRSTMGDDGVDSRFKRNWKNAKKYGYIRGAYHYYRPNENSTKQFNNFSKNTVLEKGDFIPILDVEEPSKFGKKNLQAGVLNWLKLAEAKYGVKPMIYSGRTFYENQLKGVIDKSYPIWIASYSGKRKVKHINWKFHQFTERVKVKGIRGRVDGNDFQGSFSDLGKMCIEPDTVIQ